MYSVGDVEGSFLIRIRFRGIKLFRGRRDLSYLSRFYEFEYRGNYFYQVLNLNIYFRESINVN